MNLNATIEILRIQLAQLKYDDKNCTIDEEPKVKLILSIFYELTFYPKIKNRTAMSMCHCYFQKVENKYLLLIMLSIFRIIQLKDSVIMSYNVRNIMIFVTANAFSKI